ncbi:hypothetical protein BH10BAC6_BH10BAC6_01330 [soil metagenome]
MMLSTMIVTAVLLLSSVSMLATTLHVGPSQPYANVQAAAVAVRPGDTIALHTGTYSAYQLIESVKGAPNKWIVIKRFESDVVTINGMWQFSKVNFIKIEGLAFRASPAFPGRLFLMDNGGSCATQCTQIVVDSCSFMNTTDTVFAVFKFAGVDSFQVRNCVFKDLASGAFDFNTCHFGVISGNRIENCQTGGHIKGGASLITMERNIFLNASRSPWVAFEFGGDTSPEFYCAGSTAEVRDLKFYSNLVIGGYRGLALSSAVNCQVVNNTFYECGQATIRFLTTSTLYPASTGNYVVNNIFAFGAASQYINGSTMPFGAVILASNIYYSTTNPTFTGPYWDTPALDKIKELNPTIVTATTQMFVDGTARDLHLTPSSPAIAVGVKTNDPIVDYYGYAYKTQRSVGAAEYGSSLVSVEDVAATSNTWTVYPNPSSGTITLRAPIATQSQAIADIVDSRGSVVARTSIGELQDFDCSLQPAGRYTVVIRPTPTATPICIPFVIIR